MTVYVDSLFDAEGLYHGPRAYRARSAGAHCGHRWCHMFADADDLPHLHRIAAAIGLRREWFQPDRYHGGTGHYDLTPGKRAQAIAAGAVPIGRAKAHAIRRPQRRGGEPP